MLITDLGGGGGGWYGHRCSVWTLPLSRQDILSQLNSFLSPGPRVRNVTQKNGKNMYIYWYIKIMQLLVHTLIPALCSTLYLPPFLRRHPLQLIKTIPPPHTEINQVPRKFRKIRGKKTVLDKESININSEYLEKNLSEQGTEVTTNSNTTGRRVLSPLFQWTGAEVSFYLNYWEIEKTVYLMLRKSVNSGLTMLSNN